MINWLSQSLRQIQYAQLKASSNDPSCISGLQFGQDVFSVADDGMVTQAESIGNFIDSVLLSY